MTSRYLLLGVCMLSLVASLSGQGGGLVINEIDYDQTGTDAAEFVELKNTSSSTINLANYTVQLVNATGTAVYDTINLPNVDLAAGDYYVICANATTVVNCDLDDGPDTNFIQNGVPDAVGLRLSGALVDAVSYGGDTGAPYTEVAGTTAVDSTAAFVGISRFPDGADTNNNNADWSVRCITPGVANSAATTGCTAPTAGSALTINDAAQAEGNAGTTTFTFTVSLSAPAGPGGVTFDIATADGTAQDDNPVSEDNDYVASSLTGQTIPAGSSSYTFDVLVNGDTTPETSETFVVNVTNVTGATATDAQGEGTINNDDGGVFLSVNDVTLNEGDAGTTNYVFTVSLSAPAGPGGVTFDIATADGAAQDDNPVTEDNDYVAKSLTTQTIPAGSATYAFTVVVNGDTTPESNETFFVNVTNVSNAVVIDAQGQGSIVNDDLSRIHDVQGNGAATPIPGATVMVEGVVVGDYQASNELSGFFLQEEDVDVDADPATSEGIFVFCSSCPTAVAEGQRVRVTGTVSEFFDLTEITASTAGSVVVTGTGNQLADVTPSPIDLPVAGDVDAFYEAREGMRVTFVDPLTVSEYFELQQFGQIELYEGGRPRQFTHESAPSVAGLTAHLDNLSRRRVLLDDPRNGFNASLSLPDGSQFIYHPRANGGFSVGTQGVDFFRGGDLVNALTGVLHWSFAGGSSPDAWRIRPTNATPATFTVANPRPATPPAVGGAITAVSMNLLNYFTTIDTTSSDSSGPCGPGGTLDCRGADSIAELNRQRERASITICALNADVYAFMELENTASTTIDDLLGAVNARCGGAHPYAAVNTGGTLGTDAIRVQQIYRTGILSPVGAPLVDLDAVHNRPPTAQTFDVVDALNAAFEQRFTVIANHFKSKGCPGTGGDADAGDGQGCFNATRTAQATRLLSWITSTVLPAAGDPDVLLLGDFNAHAKEDPVTTLSAGGFTDLESSIIGADAYSYVFDGQIGHLDYAFANASLMSQVTGIGAWHINADEAPIFDYNDEVRDTPAEGTDEEKPDGSALVPPRVVFQPASPYRASDHDPILVGLFGSADLSVTLTAPPVSVLALTSTPFTVTVTNNGPSTAANVRVDFSVTSGVGVITPGTPSAGTVVGAQWQIASLPASATATLSLDVFATSGPLQTTVQVSSDTADTVTMNNTSSGQFAVSARTTDTTVQLTPATITIGDSAAAAIAVTVTQPSGLPAFPPVGALTLSSSVAGDVVTACTLTAPPATTDVASCQVTITPVSVGPRTITATFGGNSVHAPGAGTGSLLVNPRSTTTVTASQAAVSSDTPQTVVLTASVSSSRTVDAGTVLFTVTDESSATVGVPVTSAPLTDGTATVNYTLPANTPAQTLTIAADYSGASEFNPSGSIGTLTVTAALPTIASVTPATGPTSGGTPITITGTNFAAGATVTIGGVAAANVTVVDATTITAETPAHAAGIVDVTVTMGSLPPATLADAFEYLSDWRLTVTRVGAGSGRVVSIGDGIACGDTCSATFPSASTVELVAIPAADSMFAGWSGDVDCADGRITLDSDVACTARFTRLTDKTMVDLDGNGLADVIGQAAPPAVDGSALGGRALLTASAGVVRAGDFNGDGKTDVFDYDPITGAWRLGLASGSTVTGTFAPRRSPMTLELDGDGRTDLAFVDPVTGEIQLCAATAFPACALTLFAPAGADIYPLDADGNSRADLLAYVPATGQVQFLLSGFGSGVGPAGADVTVLDVDGDRRSDVLFYNAATGAVTLAVNRATGFTLASYTIGTGWTMRRAQLTRDGFDDLLAYHPATGAVLLAVSGGNGTFAVSVGAIVANYQLSVADFNGDGITDGFLYDAATGTVVAGISLGPASYFGIPLILPSGLNILTQGGFRP